MRSLFQPRDPRWQGSQRWYFAIDLLKNIILFSFTILVIVEVSLYRKWYNSAWYTTEYDSPETVADFFVRIGILLVTDILSIILTHSLSAKSSFHPNYAITQACIIFAMHPVFVTLNVILSWSREYKIDHFYVWRRMNFAELGLQAVLGICWAGLIWTSALAVRQHRKRVREAIITGAVGRAVSEAIELKGLDA